MKTWTLRIHFPEEHVPQNHLTFSSSLLFSWPGKIVTFHCFAGAPHHMAAVPLLRASVELVLFPSHGEPELWKVAVMEVTLMVNELTEPPWKSGDWWWWWWWWCWWWCYIHLLSFNRHLERMHDHGSLKSRMTSLLQTQLTSSISTEPETVSWYQFISEKNKLHYLTFCCPSVFRTLIAMATFTNSEK